METNKLLISVGSVIAAITLSAGTAFAGCATDDECGNSCESCLAGLCTLEFAVELFLLLILMFGSLQPRVSTHSELVSTSVSSHLLAL